MVSPMNSPVRLGVSPAAASTPTGVFSQRFEALFTCAGALGCVVCLAPELFLPGLSARECRTAWSTSHCLATSPLCLAARLHPPTSLDVSSLPPWLSDFHTVRFSGRSGCFLFLNLLLSFFWLCEEAQCVYLHLYLGQKSNNRKF